MKRQISAEAATARALRASSLALWTMLAAVGCSHGSVEPIVLVDAGTFRVVPGGSGRVAGHSGSSGAAGRSGSSGSHTKPPPPPLDRPHCPMDSADADAMLAVLEEGFYYLLQNAVHSPSGCAGYPLPADLPSLDDQLECAARDRAREQFQLDTMGATHNGPSNPGEFVETGSNASTVIQKLVKSQRFCGAIAFASAIGVGYYQDYWVVRTPPPN